MKEKSLTYIEELFQRYASLKDFREEIIKAVEILKNCIEKQGTIFVCGNGGSAADSEHIVGELVKSFLKKRPIEEDFKEKLFRMYEEKGLYYTNNLERGIRAISLVSGVALPTAFANDVAPEMVFAQQFYVLAKEQDVLWAISTSGNSTNVNYALAIAKAMNCNTIGLSGKTGGEMSALLDVEFRIKSDCTPYIQEMHLPLYHCICAILEEEIF